MRKCLILFYLVLSAISNGWAQGASGPDSPKTVVFICEHGAYKSIVAAANFNKLAKEQGLNIRAIARGTAPSKEVKSDVLKGLQKDGLFPETLTPRKLSNEDLAKATLVVTFCSLPNDYRRPSAIENWDSILLVDDNYINFRDSVLPRVKLLVNNLKAKN